MLCQQSVLPWCIEEQPPHISMRTRPPVRQQKVWFQTSQMLYWERGRAKEWASAAQQWARQCWYKSLLCKLGLSFSEAKMGLNGLEKCGWTGGLSGYQKVACLFGSDLLMAVMSDNSSPILSLWHTSGTNHVRVFRACLICHESSHRRGSHEVSGLLYVAALCSSSCQTWMITCCPNRQVWQLLCEQTLLWLTSSPPLNIY